MDCASVQKTKLTAELVLRAYAAGIFPMAENGDDSSVFWVDPQVRGILPMETFHIPRKLRKIIRRGEFEIRIDSAYEYVVGRCAEATADRAETWINKEIRSAYLELHRRGFAHSVETWMDGHLVGGLYGVSLGAAFFGESMFSRVKNASKVALVCLVSSLRSANYKLLDIQFVTDHLRQFGAVEIPSSIYLERLDDAIRYQAIFPTNASINP